MPAVVGYDQGAQCHFAKINRSRSSDANFLISILLLLLFFWHEFAVRTSATGKMNVLEAVIAKNEQVPLPLSGQLIALPGPVRSRLHR